MLLLLGTRVVLWRLAGADRLDGPADLAERVRDSQFTALPITTGHGVRAGRLPALHRDPFDRILIAQAQIEGMTIVTRDQRIPQYDVPVMAV
ncbi:PIN domain-containing protein [Streptomyces sp. SID5594]|uniref:type II toxin-antitoxin system VapC family toxin n=1 Tax=Streptomyces TaxID=1883 RepID=UPI0003698726|nr:MULTISPECIES: type II toxin-antitoxin system VapC family toxin [unclassified Streptomyces]MZF53055.1 PIN domain-containing protein [Streptomyces sp. SID5594]